MKLAGKRLLYLALLLGLFQTGQSGCGGSSGGPTLEIEIVGQGRVVSDPEGIDCGTECEAGFPDGTQVSLTAVPAPGHKFVGWSGGCQGAEACALTLSSDVQVTAAFEPFRILFASSLPLGGNGGSSDSKAANIWVVNADGSGLKPITLLTADEAANFDHQWSPDNSRIVFVSNRALNGSDSLNLNGTLNIWVMDFDGSNPKPLTQLTANGADAQAPRWSSDGGRIVFHSSADLNGNDAANANFTRNIWTVDADGSNLGPLTELTSDNSDAVAPSYSPDGSEILYASQRALGGANASNANNVFNIWKMGSDGGVSEPMTQMSGMGVINLDPKWSPDGSRIVFVSSRALDPADDSANLNGVQNIWLMNADGSDPTPLTRVTANGASSFDPSWSAEGDRIAFISQAALSGNDALNINGTLNVWRMDSDGQNRAPLTFYTVNNIETLGPEFSPNGDQVAFGSEGALDGSDALNLNGGSNIFVRNLEGDGFLALTQNTFDKVSAAQPQYSH